MRSVFHPQHHSGYQQMTYKSAAAKKVFLYFFFATARPFNPKEAACLAVFLIIAKSGTTAPASRFSFGDLFRSLLGLLRGITYQTRGLAPAPIFRKARLAPVPRILGVAPKGKQVVMGDGLVPLIAHFHR